LDFNPDRLLVNASRGYGFVIYLYRE